MSIHWNFVTAPYAVSGISPVKLFFDNGLAHITEAGVIFLPSRGGIGHDPGEWTAPEDIGRGLALLADTVVTLARTFACTASGERASGAGAAGGTASVCGSVSRPSEE